MSSKRYQYGFWLFLSLFIAGFLGGSSVMAGSTHQAQSKSQGGHPAKPSDLIHGMDPSSLPDVLNCTRFSWVKNCKAINRQAKYHPNAPIRVRGKHGLPFTFAPDTPPTVIAHTLNPTPETARRMVRMQHKKSLRNQKAARLARDAIRKEYGSFGFKGFKGRATVKSIDQVQTDNAEAQAAAIQDPSPTAQINPANVRVFIFYDTNCGPCRQSIPVWRRLAKAHPKLSIQLLQLDRNPAFTRRLKSQYHLNAAPLSGRKRGQIMKHVKRTPTVWVQDQRSNTTKVIQGYHSVSSLEQIIASVSR